jgi:hypothetical protein
VAIAAIVTTPFHQPSNSFAFSSPKTTATRLATLAPNTTHRAARLLMSSPGVPTRASYALTVNATVNGWWRWSTYSPLVSTSSSLTRFWALHKLPTFLPFSERFKPALGRRFGRVVASALVARDFVPYRTDHCCSTLEL